MPQIRTPLVIDHYYHIFNRGVARQPTFLTRFDYKYALGALEYYLYSSPQIPYSQFLSLGSTEQQNEKESLVKKEKIVEIISYVLMPNHFHLLLKQTQNEGISTFMSKWGNSYARYFNAKHKRVGPVFQGRFKSVLVETTEQLIHLSRYIHLNPVVSAVVSENKFEEYEWSSFREYINKGSSGFCSKNCILEHFRDVNEYKNFVEDRISYGKELEKIKHLSFELDE